MNQQVTAGHVRKTKKDAVTIKTEIDKINPIQVTYQFDPKVIFNFDKGKTAIVPLTIQIQNLLQTGDCAFDCKLVAKADNDD